MFESAFCGENPSKHLVTFLSIATFIGLWEIFKFTLSWLWYLWKCLARGRQDLYRKYAKARADSTKPSFAVVTGGSDGIGLGMCH